MPTYEFECPTGHQFDKFYRKISDAPVEVPCPECGQTAQRRLSGGAGLIFKGSGFYITDYGKDGKKQPGKPASTEAPSPSGSDAKPAAEGKSAEPDSKPAESKAASSDKGATPGKGSTPGKGTGAAE